MMEFALRESDRVSGAACRTKTISILLIGPLAPPIGGDTTLFGLLVDDLRRNERFDLQIINTSRGPRGHNHLFNLWAAFRVTAEIIRHSTRIDLVSFHASRRGMFMFGPLVYVLARLHNKPFIVRLFGGWFHEYYKTRSRFGQWLLQNTVLSANRCLFETRRIVTFFQQIGHGNPTWFANYTRLELMNARKPHSSFQRTSCKRLIFLGHVKDMKGVGTILECAGQLPNDVSIDVFGPLYDYTAEQIDEGGQGQIRYRGILSREQVIDQLWHYDALLLPTFYDTEGYPGVIIEAFCHEMPVITTRRGAITEIVDHSCGVLIEPGNSQELQNAIQSLHDNPAQFVALCEGAKSRQRLFSDKIWSSKFAQFCEEALSGVHKDSGIRSSDQG